MLRGRQARPATKTKKDDKTDTPNKKSFSSARRRHAVVVITATGDQVRGTRAKVFALHRRPSEGRGRRARARSVGANGPTATLRPPSARGRAMMPCSGTCTGKGDDAHSEKLKTAHHQSLDFPWFPEKAAPQLSTIVRQTPPRSVVFFDAVPSGRDRKACF